MSHVLRVPKLDLATILAQQNPRIDLKVEAYETSTRNFLKAVSHYAQNAQAEITRRKATFVNERKRIADKTHNYENETNTCKMKELELIAELEKEREERKEGELSVAALDRQLKSIKEQCSLLDVEIEQRRAVVLNLRRERERERSLLNKHATRTAPELYECERWLQCIIEGIDVDKILFRFTHIDPNKPSREFSLVLDVSGHTYKVPTTSPFLPNLPIMLDTLNESRNVYAFVKQVRNAFVETVAQDT